MVVSIDAWDAWAPGLECKEDWQAWALGQKQLSQNAAYPSLPFLDPLFKRRFSQLSRMVLHVGHTLIEGLSDVRVVFASHYGEIGQQYKISKSLIDSGEVAPAGFSLSVFNTPVALLSISSKNHGYATALFGGANAFETAMLDVVAHLQQTPEQPIILIVGDELIPEDYSSLVPGRNQPYAMGFRVSLSGTGTGLKVALAQRTPDSESKPSDTTVSSLQFLSWLLKADKGTRCSLLNSSIRWVFEWA